VGIHKSKGTPWVKPQFDKVMQFSEGLAHVEVNLKNGFIDNTGKYVIEPRYYSAFSFSEGMAAVAKDDSGTWGYIDHKGSMIIPERFSWAGPFSDGMAQVLLAPNASEPSILKSGYIDKTGKMVIEPRYEWAAQFSEGLALVAEAKPNLQAASNRKAFIDKGGNQVTGFFDDAEDFGEGLAAVRVNWLWGFIDRTGTIVIPPMYELVSASFSEGFAGVRCKEGGNTFINTKGERLTDCSFHEVSKFSEGLAAAVVDKRWGFINTRGEFEISPQFDYAEPFLNGLARVRVVKDNKMYQTYINHRGESVRKLLLMDNLG
jgi:hypothetical protein